MADTTNAVNNGIPTVEVDPKQPWSPLGQALSAPPGQFPNGIETGLYNDGIEGLDIPDIGSGDVSPDSQYAGTPARRNMCSVTNPIPKNGFGL